MLAIYHYAQDILKFDNFFICGLIDIFICFELISAFVDVDCDIMMRKKFYI